MACIQLHNKDSKKLKNLIVDQIQLQPNNILLNLVKQTMHSIHRFKLSVNFKPYKGCVTYDKNHTIKHLGTIHKHAFNKNIQGSQKNVHL